MNYYEEFGVRADATSEEIHRAYKALARLVHPDIHSDQRLRDAAERQMRRINEIFEVLISPEKRRVYDEGLAAAALPAALTVAPVAKVRSRPSEAKFHEKLLENWYWVFMGFMVLGIFIWYVAAPKPSPIIVRPKATVDVASSAASVPPKDEKQSNYAQVPENKTISLGRNPTDVEDPVQPKNQTNRASDEGRHLQSFPPIQAQEEPPAPEIRLPQRPESVSIPAVAPESNVATPAPTPKPNSEGASIRVGKNWAGSWLYVPKPSEPNKFQYAAEYVELTLSEQDGKLNGTYWSRYRIPDQAIASEVRLRLNGKSMDANTLDLHWISADGAEGESQLILEGPDIMTFNWWTVHSGPRPGLSSGAARLIRQRRP